MRDGLEWLPPYLDAKDRFTLEYNTTNSYILHYSNVRSALASFLITVALASFAAYYSTTNSDRTSSMSGATSATLPSTSAPPVPGSQPDESATEPATERGKTPHLLWIAGYLFLGAAVFSSLWFSYLTERATEYSKALWRWGVEGRGGYPGGFRSRGWEPKEEIRKGVSEDPMNGLLLGGALALAIAFTLSELLT